jgi:hypothetical protein
VTPETFQIASNQRFADNELMKIRPAYFRAFAADIRATFVPQVAANVPEYNPNFFYFKEYLVTFNDLFYRTKQEGFLPAPTPGQETAEWKPALLPLSPVLPYDELPVLQGQVLGQRGQLEPSKLYRFQGRVDVAGDALDDVLVVAVSRYKVSEADAYTLGLDPHTQEELLLPVSYDLATDTTAPRAAGAVDAYTRDESDARLATKGDLAVQQQHTQQLATLGVKGSPVYGFFKAGGVPFGYASLDEAVADPAPKISYEFNAPVLTLTKSNPADGSGWAFAVAGLGRTLQLGDNAVLTLPGDDAGTLTFQDFYLEQAPKTRGGKVRLLTSAPASTPVARLPRLGGYCGRPLEFVNGGAAALTGNYSSIIGTGTVYALEPFQCDNVGAGVTVVRAGAGAGTVKTVNGVAPDASGAVALPQLDLYGYSAAKRSQVFGLFTTANQVKAVDVALAGDTSTGIGSQIPDLPNGVLYLLVPDPDNPMPGPNGSVIGTPTWLRTRS